MKPLISIVVPVYNVEKHLRKCVNSIVKQTYSNLEILLIDDGSTDKSGIICDELAGTDSRIKVYHKENGGLSSARNYGIDKTKGEFVGFIDSDDYIDSDMYQHLLSLIIDYNADISMCRNADVYNGRILPDNIQKTTIVADSEKAIDLVLKGELASVSAVNKLYHRSLFEKLRYPEGKTLEDAFVIVEILDACNRVVISTEKKYFYVHRGESITTQKYSSKNLDAIEAYKKNYNIIKEKYPGIIETAEMRLCWAHFYVMDRIIYDNSAENEEIKNKIREYLVGNIHFIMRNKQFSKGRKLAAMLLKYSPQLYKKCVMLQTSRRFVS